MSLVVIVPEPPKISRRKQRRVHAMLWAYLNFHARKEPEKARNRLCWILLLEWARLGGKSDEVPAVKTQFPLGRALSGRSAGA
jgi:hypothetical protein